MSFELVNTSVPKGLKPGSRGFTTVAFTEGMPANYVQLCESLSGYIHVYGLENPQYCQNPPAYSHLISTVGGRTFSILSRVASYRKDYTGRSNKLAHHFMFKVEERTACGPAVAMDGGGIFFDKWEEEPKLLPENRVSLKKIEVGLKATHWEKIYGDAGAAGVLAQAFLDTPDRPAFIIFQPGVDLLPLIAEAQALLPEERRWDVTFSTYFTALPVGMKCAWRCCLPESDALVAARRTPGALVINLIDKKPIEGTLPADKTLEEVARTGNPKALIAETTPPSPPTIKAAPVTSMPPPRAGTASPRISLDLGKNLKPEPPTQGRKKTQQKQNRIPVVQISIAVGVLVLLFCAAFFVRQYLERKKPGSMAEKTQPVETAPEAETRSQAAVEPVVTLPEPRDSTRPPQLEAPTEQKPEPEPKATPPAKAIIFGHIEENRNFVAPASITFWDVNAVLLANAPATNAMDGGTRYGSYARHQIGRFSSIPASVAFFRAEYATEQVVLFVRPIQVKFQPDSTNVIFQGNDRELLKSWIVKCTNTISANLFRGGAGFNAEVPDKEAMRIVLKADQIDPWDRPVKEAEENLQNLQKQLNDAKRRVQEFDGRWKQLAEQYAAADKETDKNIKAERSLPVIRGYGEYVYQVRQFIRQYEGLVKPLRQPQSPSLAKLLTLENDREHLEFEKQTLSLRDAEFTARKFTEPLSLLSQAIESEASKNNIEQAEVALRRAQDSSAPTKAEIMLDGRVIVEATTK